MSEEFKEVSSVKGRFEKGRCYKKPPRNADELPRRFGLLTVKEAAIASGLAEGTIRYYLRERGLPYVVKPWRVGWLARKAVLIPLHELQLFILHQTKLRYKKKIRSRVRNG